MIQVEYRPKSRVLQVQGHAEYAPIGKDIVCAGVSALIFGLVEYLQQTGNVSAFKESKGSIYVKSKRADRAFDVTVCGLKNLERVYPKNVAVKIVT